MGSYRSFPPVGPISDRGGLGTGSSAGGPRTLNPGIYLVGGLGKKPLPGTPGRLLAAGRDPGRGQPEVTRGDRLAAFLGHPNPPGRADSDVLHHTRARPRDRHGQDSGNLLRGTVESAGLTATRLLIRSAV